MGKYLSIVKNGTYEYATRKIGKDGAVIVIPQILTTEGLKFQLILSKRPTFDLPILEFPAGLIDKEGESIEDVALRELKEETGWTGKAIMNLISQFKSPSSAGLSDEVLYFVPVVLEEQGEPNWDGNEKITILPLMSLEEITQYIEMHETTILISSRVLMFLYGMMLGSVETALKNIES